jgi:hypothetical protein
MKIGTLADSHATEADAERHSFRPSLPKRGQQVGAMKAIRIRGRKLALVTLLGGCSLLTPANSLRAGLGGDASSVDADAAALHGSVSAPAGQGPSQPASYQVRQFVSGKGTPVREYFAPSGPVFGVAWEGRRPPDLSVLLGSYYSEYVNTSERKDQASLHHEAIQGPDVIVMLGGHMGHLRGHAYVSALAPAGLDAKAIVK